MISLAQMAASAVLGAFIGYSTNALAIKSLFRPLRARWYTLGWQGVIPRNRSKLADNIAHVVGEDLLHRDYLVEQIQRPALQENLAEFIAARLRELLGMSLADLFARLPASWQEEGLVEWTRRALEGAARWSEGEAAGAFKEALLDEFEGHLRGLELGELLTREQAEGLVAGLGRMLTRDETREQLIRVLDEQLERALGADTPLEELVPAELRQLLHERLRDEVPALMQRLASWLSTRENVEYMSQRILAALESYVEGENWLFGVGLSLFGDQIREAITERIPQVAYDYLHSVETRRKIEQQLVDSINGFLQRPLSGVTGVHRQILAEKLSFVAATWITSEEMERRLGQFLLGEYERRTSGRMGELLPVSFWKEMRSQLLELTRLSPERVNNWTQPFSDWLRQRLRESRTQLREWLRLTPETEKKLALFICERASELLRREVPVLVEQLDIGRMVHEKIMGFDLLRVERLIKNIISDQLRYINLLGGILGGLVGLLLPFLNAYLRTAGM